MYLCDACGEPFDRPSVIYEDNGDGENHWKERHDICPHCGEEHYHEVDDCPICGEYKTEDNILCPACKKILKEKWADFLDTLEGGEKEQLDEWLDGMSIDDWRSWN